MKRYQTFLIDFCCYILGSFLYASAVTVFISPNQMSGGGLTGVAIMLNYIFSTPIGLVILLLNIPLFIWGYLEAGKSFIMKSAIATFTVSIAIDLTSSLLPKYEGDLMLACIFGGMLSGLGLGLMLLRNATTGGSDLAAALLARKIRHFSIGRIVFVIDLIIVLFSIFVFDSIESALYAMIVIFISAKTIDVVLYGVGAGSGKMIFIISPKSSEISLAVQTELERGVTLLRGTGGYTGTETDVLLCATRRHEWGKIQDIAFSIDPDCFIIAGEAAEIYGLGFLPKK